MSAARQALAVSVAGEAPTEEVLPDVEFWTSPSDEQTFEDDTDDLTDERPDEPIRWDDVDYWSNQGSGDDKDEDDA